jgi:acetyl/propionyl-CoA carboxylase alpha subunit/acetyl-CoA carboxylase carboxyltransferase component
MTVSLLIANRGEIAIRICRAASEVGLRSVAVYADDDADSPHVSKADAAVPLGGPGVAAYLDIERVIDAARRSGCSLVHPGYGFLSERADFAQRCADASLTFVGPTASTLAALGDKAAARALALRCDVPLLEGTGPLADADGARALMQRLAGPVMLKAVAGGGGRGIRIVHDETELDAAYARCASEALHAFGDGRLYAEAFLDGARHIEVQVVGDGQGEVRALGERECTLQRRHQKLIELAPSPSIGAGLRQKLFDASLRMARELAYSSLGTFEFLVVAGRGDNAERLVFLEANPRLQVEHTVTEAVTGIDLVQLQLRLALGDSLAALASRWPTQPQGQAMQLRVNMERLRDDGQVVPTGGLLTAFDPPAGPGVRVDTQAHAGFRSNPGYDALLAKLIVHTPSSDYATLLRKAYRALCETRIEGIETNIAFLQALLQDSAVQDNRIDTRHVETHLDALRTASGQAHPTLHPLTRPSAPAETVAFSAVEGSRPLLAPASGRLVKVEVQAGDAVSAGQALAVLESMKNEFVISAELSGTVVGVRVKPGDTVVVDAPLFDLVADGPDEDPGAAPEASLDLDALRADLLQVHEMHALRMDPARPQAVKRRHDAGQRTVRENVAHLCDEGSFVEYGGLALAAQRGRRSVEELRQVSPADGLVAGVGAVNGDLFDASRTRCVVMAYDYTVFAGTQGYMAHEKKRRMLRLAHKWRLPVVLFAEGGGGRPGDTDHLGGLRLYNPTFWGFAKLSSRVPVVGIVSGYCFAGNAALLSVCDVVIATQNASIGMGGPAMIEGGGLGAIAAEAVGPVGTQSRNGVIDIVVPDEASAVDVAKRYLSYFQGPVKDWSCADVRRLRHIIPEDPRRPYEMRRLIDALADSGSVLELRRPYGVGMITCLARIEGRTFAILANNPAHLSGAIDAEASDKAAHFAEQAQAAGLPLLALCDTPGFMVGAEAEATGLVRRAGRFFIAGSRMTVPCFTVVVRKAYGLGAVAMVGGNAHEQMFTAAWPTGHFGKMGLEGYVTLAYRKELAAIADPQARRRRIDEMVTAMHEKGTALNTAPFLSIDDVIDPAQTRQWLIGGLTTARQQRGDANLRPEPQDIW